MTSRRDASTGGERAADVLSAIAQGTSAAIGREFFQSLARCLAGTLHMEYAFIGEVMNDACTRVATLALCADGRLMDNFEYDLAGTPCENVVGQTVCSYPAGVRERFPKDPMLVEMGVESYLGLPLFDSARRALGLIVVMGRRPLPDPALAEATLRLFAARAAAELRRTRTEEALRESEERYRLLFEQNLAGVLRSSLEGRCLDCNEAFVRMFGYASKQELLAHPAVDLHPTPGHRARFLAELRQGRELKNYEVELRRKDGSPLWGLVNAGLISSADGGKSIQGTIVDLTERKQGEEALRQSEERQRLLLEGVRVIFWEADPKTLSCTHVSGQALALTGYAPEQWYAPDFWVDHLHPEDRDEAVGHCLAAVQRGEPHELEYRMLKADGQWIWLRNIVSVLLGPEGVQLVRGVLVDVTDRKRAEEALRTTENRYRALFEHVPYPILAIEPADGSFLDFNEAAHQFLGYTRAEFSHLTLADIESRETPDQVAAHIQRILKAGCDEFETEQKTKNGELRNVVVSVRRLELNDRTYLQSIMLDITERRRAEEEARRHQTELAHVARVSTMGEMASGLAHELNQPLTAVVNFAQGALRRLRTDTNVHQDVLEAIENASASAHRAAEIIRRLSDLTQKREPQRSRCDLNEAVREIVSFAAADARDHGVLIGLDLAVELPPILADNIQIQQVVLNLVRNGIEAMSGIEAGERILHIRTSVAGDAEQVAVRDRGPGLTPEAQERIFTPFFTTKPRGMGMGLSISRSIIDAHGGQLWATPNPEGGTTFQFTLPIASGASEDENRPNRLRRG